MSHQLLASGDGAQASTAAAMHQLEPELMRKVTDAVRAVLASAARAGADKTKLMSESWAAVTRRGGDWSRYHVAELVTSCTAGGEVVAHPLLAILLDVPT
jgi:hypothetical protein